MSTFTQIYYHIVFSTKDRMPALSADKRENLFRYDTSKASRTITRSSLSETNCVLVEFGVRFDEKYLV